MDTVNWTDAWPLACSVCDSELRRGGGMLACSAGHSFDVAREGYVNLLPSQHRVRGIDGDVASQLRARRSFLESGYYRPLCEMLTTQVEEILQNRDPASSDSTPGACVLEVGCGEGYYIGSIAAQLRGAAGLKTTCVGVDLSKSATRLAAKRYEDVTFLVSNVHRRIYLQNRSVSVLLDIFAPRNPAEFARVLEPDGYALIVIPSKSHLGSLRARLNLLDIQENKEGQVLEQLRDGFRLVDRCEISYSMELPPDAINDLVNMGPNFWHRPDGPAKVGGDSITTEAAFVVLRLQRRREVVQQAD